jgi:hypothetical protein
MSEQSSQFSDYYHYTPSSESLPEVPQYEKKESIFLVLERDLFDIQLRQQFGDLDPAVANALYDEFEQPFVPSVEPTRADVSRMVDDLLPEVRSEIEGIQKRWQREEFFRGLTDVDPETGETVWVYNARPHISLDPGTAELKLFGLDERTPITMWRFGYSITPERDEHGNYVPYMDGETVHVLTEKEQTDLDEAAAEYLSRVWKDASATQPLSESEQRYLEEIKR